MEESLVVLVTGASGFIGKKLVRKFLSKGWIVIAACRSPEKLIQINHQQLHVIQYDLEDSVEILEEQVKSVDLICHLAAYIPIELENTELAEKCYRINSLGTLKLMEFGVRKGIKQFIYYSSGNAYDYTDTPVKEDSKIYPSIKATYYLASKLMAELYVDHFRFKKILNTTIFRLSSVYGYGMNQHEFIHKSIESISCSKAVEIYNNDLYRTDFVYVGDIIKATCLSIEKDIYGTFNLGSGKNYLLGNVARMIAEILGEQNDCIKILPIDDLNSISKGFSALNITKLIETFKIEPTPIFQGLQKMIKDMKG